MNGKGTDYRVIDVGSAGSGTQKEALKMERKDEEKIPEG